MTGAQSMTYWWILSAASQISCGAQRYPIRHPVIAYAFENPFRVIVRCARSPTVAAATWFPLYVSSEYTSSLISTKSWSQTISAIARRSSLPMTAPVGLLGKFMTSALLFPVTLSISRSGLSRNWSSSTHGTGTGVPPDSVTQGE